MCGCVNVISGFCGTATGKTRRPQRQQKKCPKGVKECSQISSYHLLKFNTINLIEQDILTERRHKCNILSLCESSSVTERERNANKNTYFSVSFTHAQTTQRKRSMATIICTKYHPSSSTTLLMTDTS